MEKEELYESLFTLIPEGMFADADELGELIEDEGLEAVYPLIPEGMFEDEEEFLATFGGEKKKTLLQLVLPLLRNLLSNNLPKLAKKTYSLWTMV